MTALAGVVIVAGLATALAVATALAWHRFDRLRRDVTERDAEIARLNTWIDQLDQSHARAADEWADRCRAANAVAVALDPYAIERTN